MAAFNRGLDDKFVKALNKEYEKGKDGWWSQFVDDKELFLAIRESAVDVYFRGCTLIHLEWRPRKEKIVANTHYKYLLRSTMEPKSNYVDVVDGRPSTGNASAYFADQVSAAELKKAARRYVGEEKRGVHDILQNNPHILDVEVAISDGEKAPRVDFAALQRGVGQTHIVFYEVKHFDNPELRSRGKPKVIEQIGKYRHLLCRYRTSIADSYGRVSRNLRELKGVPERHPDRHELLQTKDSVDH